MRPSMLFLIPIKPRAKSRNWQLVEELLNGTLRSLDGQTDQDYEVIICGHERPSIAEFPGMKVRFIEAPWRPREANKDRDQDKWWKKRVLGAAAREHGAGYVMMLDGDDRVSSHLVEHVHRNADPHGYLVKSGYALDYRSAIIAPLPGVWPKTFDQSCGSCAIWKLAPDDLPRTFQDKSANYWDQIRSHRGIEQLGIKSGRPLTEVPFPAAVYTQNTGENSHDKVLRDRAAMVAKEIAAHQLPLSDEIVAAFGLSDVVDYVTGRATSALHTSGGILARAKSILIGRA